MGLGAVMLLALAGCTSSPSTSTPTDAATPTVMASPTKGTDAGISLIGEEPVLRASDLGDYDAVLTAAYFEADGMRHAYFVGFGQERGDQRVFHATSPDGAAWTVDDGDPFVDLGLDLSPPGPIPGSVLGADDGGWLMYLWGVEAPASLGAVIWRATAPSPAGPWVADPEPVLGLGEGGAWDDRALDFPSVIRTDDGYLMLYGGNGWSDLETTMIGLATSADGVDWERAADDPVVTGDLCGDPVPQAAQPRLVQPESGSLIVLWNAARSGVRNATSADGRAWTCGSTDPILEATDLPGSQGIHTLAAAFLDGEISVLIESLIPLGDSVGSEVWLAGAPQPERPELDY